MDRIGRPGPEPKACGGIAGVSRKINLNMPSAAPQFEEKTRRHNIRGLRDFLHARSFGRNPLQPGEDFRDQAGPSSFTPRVRLQRKFQDRLIELGQELWKARLAQVPTHSAGTFQQVLTTCENSRCLFRCDAWNLLLFSPAIPNCGIRHRRPSFPVTWVVPGCAATRSARFVDGTLYTQNRLVDFVDCTIIPTIPPSRGRIVAKPRRITGKDWVNRYRQLPDRTRSHLSSSSRARISESWAASTGSRHSAERSAVLSQKEAAGSARISSIRGKAPAPKPSRIPKLLTPLRSQLYLRGRSARPRHQVRCDPPSRPGQSPQVRANGSDGSQ